MMKINQHGGKEITIQNNTSLEEIEKMIKEDNNERSVWITLKNDYFNENVYDYFVKNGFELYINKDQSIARKEVKEKVELPIFPNYVVGAGGIIYNSKTKKILMIKQTYGNPNFKFPGSYSNKNESPLETAMREIYEEVGLKTKPIIETPITIFTFKNKNHILGEHCDLYFVYLLELEDEDNVNVKIDEKEIKEYKWIDLREYMKDENVSEIQKIIQKKLVMFFD